MLYVCSSLQHYSKFKNTFSKTLDLSRVPLSKLADECDAVLNHHTSQRIFLGYLEPGWMIPAADQTRIRKMFRKFDVALVCHFPESLPHSWKTEIHTFYTVNRNGNSNSINDGGSIQDQSTI
jgi:hypothetical protein